MSESEIDDAKRAIVRCAWEWWRSKRPRDWTPEDHRASPKINTLTSAEETLAEAVALLVELGGSV